MSNESRALTSRHCPHCGVVDRCAKKVVVEVGEDETHVVCRACGARGPEARGEIHRRNKEAWLLWYGRKCVG